MAGVYPRRQAARLAELLGRHFHPGITCLKAPPRRGRSDLLRQLFDLLAAGSALAPVLLDGATGITGQTQESAALQLMSRGSQTHPATFLSRDDLASRPDAAVWLEYLEAAGRGPCCTGFWRALDRLGAQRGPLCLLLDNARADCLSGASAARLQHVAVVAAPAGEPPAGLTVLALEELTVREGVLLAEGLARTLGVRFAGSAAEPFVSYAGADPFVLDAVVRNAAFRGAPLATTSAFAEAYADDLRSGTLAGWFQARLPGAAGSLERRFAMEALSGKAVDPAMQARWRHRLRIEPLLQSMAGDDWIRATADGWEVRDWPAVRDFAFLHLAGTHATVASGALTVRLLGQLEQAAGAPAEARLGASIEAGLRRMAPAAVDSLLSRDFGLTVHIPEICHVARMQVPSGELFLCHGFQDGVKRPEKAALLAVAVTQAGSPAAALLKEMDAVLGALARNEPAGALEKWLVLERASAEEREAAAQVGAVIVPFQALNRIVSPAAPPRVPPDAWEVVLRLPLAEDFEIPALRVLDHLAERHEWNEHTVSQLRMALVEACLNAIEHGRAAATARTGEERSDCMEVRFAASASELWMAVWNPGPPFDARDGAPGPGAALHRGHGLKIMHSLMDEVEVTGDLEGTTVRMLKRIQTAGSSQNEKDAAGVQTG